MFFGLPFKMNKLHLFTQQLSKHFFWNRSSKTIQEFHFSCINKKSDDEVKKSKNHPKKANENALNKLNELLKNMVEEDLTSSKNAKLDLAKPKSRRKKDKAENAVKEESATDKLQSVVKSAAETLQGDVKQIESELLLKLLNASDNTTPGTSSTLSDIVKGMKIDRESKSFEDQSRAQQVRQILGKMQSGSSTIPKKPTNKFRPKIIQRKPVVVEKINLFDAEPLNIFSTDAKDYTEGVCNRTWQNLYNRELKLAVTHPPSNYFQQMILWTEQKKIWKFPIDNEQDLDDEKKVYFAEHVFLDKHLDPWCPQKGPLRHFMELVCVGLSKNPYLTVEMKVEHINWFKNYFEEKKKILQEVGALSREADVKQIQIE